MSGRKSKLVRFRMRWWFNRRLNDEGIARQLSASPEIKGDVPVRKVRRERMRLINIHVRNQAKRDAENPKLDFGKLIDASKNRWGGES